MDGHILENASLRLRFSAHSGALIGLQARETGWELLNRPQVGLSFRLLVPLPHRRNTQVLGEEQDAPQIHAQDDHRQLNLIWPRVRAADGTELAIRVEMTVTLDDRQARFAVTVDNQSPYPVENVYAPYLGDIRPPVDAPWFKTFLYQYATPKSGRCGLSTRTCAATTGWTIPPSLPHGAPASARPCPRSSSYAARIRASMWA